MRRHRRNLRSRPHPGTTRLHPFVPCNRHTANGVNLHNSLGDHTPKTSGINFFRDKKMKPEFTKNGYCNCHNPEEWKVNDKIPVSYCEELNEYHILCEGGIELVMNYCYFCGGKLPDSLRGQLFVEIDNSEKDEVKFLTDKIDTVEKIHEVLGEPDKIVDRDLKEKDFFILKSKSKCLRWYVYYKRWKSLKLQILENEDGTLGFSISPKYAGKKH